MSQVSLGLLQDADATLVGLECNIGREIPRVLKKWSSGLLDIDI